MAAERQKKLCEPQLRPKESRGEAPTASGRVEAAVSPEQTETTGQAVDTSGMMEEVAEEQNVRRALAKVRANKGAPGVDGMRVDELEEWLDANWPSLQNELLNSTYQPSPLRRKSIPKPQGGERLLGIPTVRDRMVQQALLQQLQRVYEPSFSDHSYGFRPGRSPHQAVQRAQQLIQQGRRWVVDIDLEKFFDRVNHDMLMGELRRKVADPRVWKLVRAFLNAGVLEDGLVSPVTEGTPQGGPLSPLLSNIVLDRLDKELERRGLPFVRYADDCNIYVYSQRAAERVMESITSFINRKLKLRVNKDKSAVDRPWKRKFLGFSFFVAKGKQVRLRIALKSLQRMKQRVRELTPRLGHKGFADVLQELNRYLRGWRGYYGITQAPSVLGELDQWIRHRLRHVTWHRWKTPANRYQQLRKRGADAKTARRDASSSKGPWRMSNCPAMCIALSTTFFDRAGLYRLAPTAP